MNKNETIELLKNQIPGFYSVEQVISLIEKIEESSTTLSADMLQELKQTLMGSITSKIDRLDSNEVVAYDSAEFEINYDNRVELNSIVVSTDIINDIIEEQVDQALHDFFSPKED